jgi:hypothetical protein
MYTWIYEFSVHTSTAIAVTHEVIAWLITKHTSDEHFGHKNLKDESVGPSGLFYEQTGHSRHCAVSRDDVTRWTRPLMEDGALFFEKIIM